MAIYPGATYRPVRYGAVARNRQGRGMLHVAVSTAVSLPPSTANTWHFYVARSAPDGSMNGSGGPAYCEQYVDTEHRAYGGVDGNDDVIIVETAGGTGTSAALNAEPWTRAQELRLADLMRWEAGQPGGAPLELLPDARAGRRGWGPHRLGIKHSAGLVAGWWSPGCELWSTKLGKECPGDTKIRQIPGLLELARRGPTPTTPEDDEMRMTFDVFRSDPAQWDPAGRVGTGEIVLAAPGIWWPVPDVNLLVNFYQKVCAGPTVNVPPNWFDHLRSIYLQGHVSDHEVRALLADLPAAPDAS